MATLRTERRDALLLITLDDPKRANPLGGRIVDETIALLAAVADDDSLRAIVVTGAGKHFSAGADLAALAEIADGADPEADLADSRRLEELFARWLGCPKLTVAAVNGAAIAGGCGLATACDVVLAEERSVLGYSEVRIGFIPALVSTFLTRRLAGHHARRLLLTGERLDAAAAAEIGLVDEVVEDGRVVERALERAEAICRSASPSALAETKRLLLDSVGLEWAEALALAAERNAAQRQDPDCRRGVRSFLEHKTTPDWLT